MNIDAATETLLPANDHSNTAIRVNGVGKCYAIYDHPRDRLLEAIGNRLHALARPLFHEWVPRAYHREFWALRDVSFSIDRGEAVGVVGRNGAGKSTLLQILAGTLAPSNGSIQVYGKVAALLELGSGFSPEFTGRENVYLNASLWGLSREETDQKFDEITAFADIGIFIDQPVKTYSSGMLVRLAFAVQTALDPEILIVDEALAVGDARFQKKCYEHLDRYCKQGGTVFFVTHDSGIIVEKCSRAMIIEAGKLVSDGEPRRIAHEYHRLLFGAETLACAEKTCHTLRPEVENSERKDDQLDSVVRGDTHSDIHHSSSEVRYGSRDVEITTIGIRDSEGKCVSAIETNGEYEFYFRLKYHVTVLEQISYGFIISNKRGVEIFGTKSDQHRCYLPQSEHGSVFECSFRTLLPLVPGKYFLTVAVAPANNDKENFYDCRFDAFEFSVIGNPRCFLTGLLDLGGVLSSKKLF